MTIGVVCKFIEKPELDEIGNADTAKREPGDMWFLDCTEAELRTRPLTAQYWRDNSGRKPVVVMLPERSYHLVDGQCFSGDCTVCGHATRAFSSACPRLAGLPAGAEMPCAHRGHYDAWTVTGSPPNLTVSPSINIVGRWHGWLRNGVLTGA